MPPIIIELELLKEQIKLCENVWKFDNKINRKLEFYCARQTEAWLQEDMSS